jgi:chromosome segregation ATPase
LRPSARTDSKLPSSAATPHARQAGDPRTAKLAVARAASTTATAQTASERFQQLSDQRLELAASLDEALPDEEDISMAGIVGALNLQVEARTERRALEVKVKDIAVKLERLTSDMSQARQKLAVLQQRRDDAQRELETAQGALSDACGRLMALAAECAWRDVAAALEAGRNVSQGLKTHRASTKPSTSKRCRSSARARSV